MIQLLSGWQVGCLVISLSCYTSFIWSVFRFFHRTGKMPLRMKAVSLTGSASMFGHLVGIGFQPTANPIRIYAAMILFMLALGLFWWALRTTWHRKLGIAFNVCEPANIVQHGPYCIVRHPIYLSYMLAWIGGACAISGVWAWTVPVVMGYQYLVAIRHEESIFLASPLAADYKSYMRNVGMLIPNPLKLGAALMRPRSNNLEVAGRDRD